MKLLTKAIEKKLRANAAASAVAEQDPVPVLKLFNPCGAATWLITELDEDGDTMFGLCDLGFGSPELGYVSLKELASIRLPFGLSIERDLRFKGEYPLSKYAEMARASGSIAA